MISIAFMEHSGSEHAVQATEGQSLMRAAVSYGVPGIDAECGGACACATCHVYIQPEWLDRVGPAQGGEREMLDFALDVRGDSRLACQITVSPQLNGLVVGMPVAQS
ncbi:MAG: Ferredoxin-6 [Delftia tsuruhatensis]|nr:MAG: Ferredoxin-6 [Delftia tsuruhatensis]